MNRQLLRTLVSNPKLAKLRVLIPPLLLAFITFLVFFTTLVLKHRTFYVFPDNIDQFYAWYQKLAYAVHRGTLPIWDANVSAGHSFVGELQAGVFYPVNLVWVWLFGSAQGISIFFLELIVVFHFWLASLGMYYAARSLGLSKVSSYISGLTFAFGGTVAIRSVSQTAIFFGLCLIPWVFVTFHMYVKSKKIRYLFLCGLAEGLILLAGHIQPWFHANVLITLYVVFRTFSFPSAARFKTLLKGLAAVAAGLLISLLVALPQMALSAQYLPKAVRFVGDTQPIGANDKVSFNTFTKALSYKPQDFLSIVNPVQYPVVDGNEIYIGLMGLAIIIAAVFFAKSELRKHAVWRTNKRFLTGTILIAVVIMLGYWTFIPAIMREVPLVSQIRQLARYSILVHFCLSIMVAISVEVLHERFKSFGKKRLILLLVGGLVGLNSIYLFLISKHGFIDKHFVYQNMILAVVLFLCALFTRYTKHVLLLGACMVAIAQPVWFLPKIQAFPSTYAPTYYRRSDSINFLEPYYGKARVLIEDNALPVNIGDVFNIQTVNGYGATLHKSFYNFLTEPETEATSGLHMDLFNTQFLVSKKPHPELSLKLYDEDREIYVYERPNYMPRAFLASQFEACHQHLPGCDGVMLQTYSDTHIQVNTAADQPDKLVLSEVDYTGWKAYVDNQPVEIQTYGNNTVKLFRSIDVPAGKHTVDFRYKPF